MPKDKKLNRNEGWENRSLLGSLPLQEGHRPEKEPLWTGLSSNRKKNGMLGILSLLVLQITMS